MRHPDRCLRVIAVSAPRLPTSHSTALTALLCLLAPQDLGIRAVHVVEWGAGHEAWDDAKGVEAAYDLLTAGALRDKRALPRVGLCGDAAAVDALGDAVAACPSEARRVALMLEQVLAMSPHIRHISPYL